MTRPDRIAHVEYSERFKRDFRRLPVDLQKAVEAAVRDLVSDPVPRRLRLEKLQGLRKPDIYTIHVTPNHSHKLSFEFRGDTAFLRKLGTHKEIDRTP